MKSRYKLHLNGDRIKLAAPLFSKGDLVCLASGSEALAFTPHLEGIALEVCGYHTVKRSSLINEYFYEVQGLGSLRYQGSIDLRAVA